MRILIGLMVVWLALPAQAGEPRFFNDLGDVPVMPALTELPDRTVVFDKPAGRIAQVAALSAPGVSGASVQAFYAQSLPAFGWQAAGLESYVREGQILTITAAREGAHELVLFRLEPR